MHKKSLYQTQQYPDDISTFHAVDKLVQFGLEHFAECPEWFTPVKDVFFKPWNGDVTKAQFTTSSAAQPNHSHRH